MMAASWGCFKVAILSLRAHLNTVITRIENAALNVAHESTLRRTLTQQTCAQIERQQIETAQVAAAMRQMAAAISEVSAMWRKRQVMPIPLISLPARGWRR